MSTEKTLLDYTDLFSPKDYKKNDKIIYKYFKDKYCKSRIQINPKTAGGRRRVSLTSTPVVFRKTCLLKRGWNPGFLWLLILLYGTSFLKISLNFLKSFRSYEEFLCLYYLFSSIFINFLDFLTFPCYKETNDVSL